MVIIEPAPTRRPDALTLLHELEVHQVELDLQAQALRESRDELELALRRQIEVYDCQPVGCVTIDSQLMLHELNQTGAEILGIGRYGAYGLVFDAFLGGHHRFRSAVSSIDASERRASRLLRLCPKDGPEWSVLATNGADPAANRYLVSLTNPGNEQEHRPEAI